MMLLTIHSSTYALMTLRNSKRENLTNSLYLSLQWKLQRNMTYAIRHGSQLGNGVSGPQKNVIVLRVSKTHARH